MKNSYDLVSSFYDQLAGWIFGRKWEEIRLAPAGHLRKKQDILVVGGGTGKLLESLHDGNHVTYVELSENMIRLAQARQTEASIQFDHTDYLTWASGDRFDAILFPFFLDNFQLPNLRQLLAKARNELKPGGELHVIDFQQTTWAKNFLILLMYCFFRIIAHVEGNRLLDFDREIQSAGFELKASRSYYNDWIFYRIYRKSKINLRCSSSKDA